MERTDQVRQFGVGHIYAAYWRGWADGLRYCKDLMNERWHGFIDGMADRNERVWTAFMKDLEWILPHDQEG